MWFHLLRLSVLWTFELHDNAVELAFTWWAAGCESPAFLERRDAVMALIEKNPEFATAFDRYLGFDEELAVEFEAAREAGHFDQIIP